MGSRKARHSVRLLGVTLVGAALAAQPILLSPTPASATVTATSHFIVTASSSNTSAFVTVIANAATDGHPNALIFVTPNDTPGGECGCVIETAPIGVIYNLFGGNRWAIFTEDTSNIPVGAQFNVLVVQHSSAYVFRHTSTATDTSGNSTAIDSTQTNGKPNALLQVTHVVEGSGTQANNHVIGVTYANNKAAIFNEDGAPMPLNTHFNVMVGSSKSNGGTASKLETVFGSGSNSVISNGRTNGNPNAIIFDTANFDPSYIGGVFDTSPTGVTYIASPTDQWAVTHQDGTAMGNGSAFNLLVFWS